DRSSQLLSGEARLQEIPGEQTDSRQTSQITHGSIRKSRAPPRHIVIREVPRRYTGPVPRKAFRFHQLNCPRLSDQDGKSRQSWFPLCVATGPLGPRYTGEFVRISVISA